MAAGTTPPLRSTADVVEVITLDLWNEYRYQITATAWFYEALVSNFDTEGTRNGDEASLTSAITHCRSLLEFYNPRLNRRSDDLWWGSSLDVAPDHNRDWTVAIAADWPQVQRWIEPMHKYLAHLTWSRRTLDLPEPADVYGQRWPLLTLMDGSLALLHSYLQFVEEHDGVAREVVSAVERVEQQAVALHAELFTPRLTSALGRLEQRHLESNVRLEYP